MRTGNKEVMESNRTLEDVVVLIADGTPDMVGDVFVSEGVKIETGRLMTKVPLTWNFDLKTPCGTAQLRKDGDRVLADLEIYPDGFRCIEPLIERGLSIYPAVGGRIEKVQSGHGEGSPRIIQECHLTHISLGDSNTDSRIPPLSGEIKMKGPDE
jgi:hypothetical protein